MPTWCIVHSRVWKMQIPYLARHCRVLTFDGPGNGLADRPSGPDAYSAAKHVDLTMDVLDATDTKRAIAVASSGAPIAPCGLPPNTQSGSMAWCS
jgi:pimeloyl-ACP methyl ester carboxylesterase